MVYDYRLMVYNPNVQTLWVTNAGNGTVLAFDDIASLPNSSSPRSIGGVQQPYPDCSSGLNHPTSLALDASDNL